MDDVATTFEFYHGAVTWGGGAFVATYGLLILLYRLGRGNPVRARRINLAVALFGTSMLLADAVLVYALVDRRQAVKSHEARMLTVHRP